MPRSTLQPRGSCGGKAGVNAWCSGMLRPSAWPQPPTPTVTAVDPVIALTDLSDDVQNSMRPVHGRKWTLDKSRFDAESTSISPTFYFYTYLAMQRCFSKAVKSSSRESVTHLPCDLYHSVFFTR
jgi:hypothetical protein